MSRRDMRAVDACARFCALRRVLLRAVSRELRTSKQAVRLLRTRYVTLMMSYLREPGTTYASWLEHGPAGELAEIADAAEDAALWDRLVDRFADREEELGDGRRARRRGVASLLLAGVFLASCSGDDRPFVVAEPCTQMADSMTIEHHVCNFGAPLQAADVFALEGVTCGASGCDTTFETECFMTPTSLVCTENPRIRFVDGQAFFAADTERLDGVAGLAIIDDVSGASCTFRTCEEL